ncbi:FecR domain-containing protein [Crocinitomix catalasitica]|nr:FecR domain-containing protein [Crocinitomix catalasitica]
MQYIDDILSKHFAAEANPQEEAVVAQWKSENESEYSILAQAWNETIDFEFKSYDAKAALIKMESQLGPAPSKTKVFRLNNVFKYAVAACAVLLVGLTAVWWINSTTFITIENDSNLAKMIELPDGSTVWLATNSSLDYHKDFESNRNINLKGEAYFEVTRDKMHPFVIETEFGNVEVLGTAFNVDVGEESTHVFVERGKVALRNDVGEVELEPGEEAFSTDGLVSKAEEATDPNILSWRTGYFVFNNTPLSQVVIELDQYYKEVITLDNEEAAGVEFNGQFRKRPVKELIEIIVLTCGVEAEYGENTIRLK